jgi:carboxyl-terminal processing protease
MTENTPPNPNPAPSPAPLRKKIRPSSAQPLYFGMVLIVGILIGTYLADTNLLTIKTGAEENPNKLVSLIDFIEENYVDSVDKKMLIEGAIESILSHLDPHSYYISPEAIAESQERINGEYEGIGMEFIVYKDTLRVVKTIAGGPAQRAGLLPGDRIIKVDGKDIIQEKLDNDKVQKMIKGKSGSEVKLSVVRKNNNNAIDIPIKRGNIPLKSVPASFMVDAEVGYVKVESFGQNTFDEFELAVRQLKSQRCKTVIVDLRGNGGGLLDQSFKMAESFLPKDKLVLYTNGMHVGKKQYFTTKDGEFKNMNVVVLVDQESASASEIFAGALQDWDKSVTVGRRTFGKGLVQHEIELPDRSAFRLTIARYYTPTGRCIQKPYSDSTNYNDEFSERYYHGELFHSDSIKTNDTLKFKTPKGRIVYGSGGITPEVFVALDTANNILLNSLFGAGVLRDFCFDYFDKNYNQLKKYKSEDDFIAQFKTTDVMLNEILKLARAKKLSINNREWNRAKSDIRQRIKSTLGRYLYEDRTAFKVLYPSDHEILKAIEVGKNFNQFLHP